MDQGEMRISSSTNHTKKKKTVYLLIKASVSVRFSVNAIENNTHMNNQVTR